MVEAHVDAAPLDDLVLKGFNHPVLAMEILRWRGDADRPGAEATPTETPADAAGAVDAAKLVDEDKTAAVATTPARRRKGT
jgi:hypothetical protein